MEHGGYAAVTRGRLWAEVCRCLLPAADPSTFRSSSMRMIYERCLLGLERYLASGQVGGWAGGRAGAWVRGRVLA